MMQNTQGDETPLPGSIGGQPDPVDGPELVSGPEPWSARRPEGGRPWALFVSRAVAVLTFACLHQTANARATAMQERNYANRSHSTGPCR